MEFYVVDPKDSDYSHWTDRVRDFLNSESMKYSEASGELYYLGDDVASPWDEASVLFTVEGEDGGIIEVRDTDEHFCRRRTCLPPMNSGPADEHFSRR